MKNDPLSRLSTWTVACTIGALVCILLAQGCSPRRLPSQGGCVINVFDHAHVQFLPDSLGTYVGEDPSGIIHLTNGRIILKKITLPHYTRRVSATLTVRVESDGDRWDKSGSVFVIPKDAAPVNLLSIAKGEAKFPAVDSTKYEKLIGTVPGEGYLPTVELLRFMTPFGVGYYSRRDTSERSRTRPVYIDGWAEETCWKADITDLFPLIQDECYIGVFIDTWTAEGYLSSVDIEIEESPCEYDPLPRRHVLPLVNTIYYIGQEYPDIFARRPLCVDFELPKTASNATLKYIVTGHGGHSGGDEFTPQRNIVTLDNENLLDFTPWRRDCASYRRFNPTSGVWAQKRDVSFYGRRGRETKTIDEMLASSDLSRSNWCPGSDVPPISSEVGMMAAGPHRLSISIPDAQPMKGNEMNHWLISCYLVWDEED